MAAIITKIVDGDYVNDDAVENTIEYALRMRDWRLAGGYGITLTNYYDIVNQFYKVKNKYGVIGGKQVMHFMFSVDRTTFLSTDPVRKLGYLLGKYFANERQVLFGIHTDTDHLHIHMIVNTIAFTNGAYCGFYDINELREYANKCMDAVLDEVYFGKKCYL